MLISLIIGRYKISKIPIEIKKIITFVFIQGAKKQLTPIGTAFFVSVRDENKPELNHVYLVTAKHVIADEAGNVFGKIFLRLNKKSGDVETYGLPLITKGNDKNVFIHNDATVDIAVIPSLPNINVYDFKTLGDELILSEEEVKNLNISEGSEVFFTGLFTPHLGEKKNYPIVRFGRVALITDEKVDWGGIKTDLYLMESFSFGGNSGSPVFFYLGSDREPGKIIIGSPLLCLAGVMKGAFQDVRPIQVIQTSDISVSVSNLGISAIVPSYKLRDILFSEEIKALRKKAANSK